jgi:hypothetical protein
LVPFDVFYSSPKELTVPLNFVGGFVGVDRKGVRFVISHTPAMPFCNLLVTCASHVCRAKTPLEKISWYFFKIVKKGL